MSNVDVVVVLRSKRLTSGAHYGAYTDCTRAACSIKHDVVRPRPQQANRRNADVLYSHTAHVHYAATH